MEKQPTAESLSSLNPPRAPWTLLAALFVGPFMALLDLSIVTVSLPAMQASLHASMSSLQWVVDAYTLALSALLLSAGSLGDRFGRKRLYLVGIGVFTLGSVVCAAAPTATVLIAGRMIQGVGATSLIPGSLSLLAQAFSDPARRARMVGVWGGVGSLAVAAGPVLGGVLTEGLGWWAIFLINLPIGVAALLLGARALSESVDPAHSSPDLGGQVTAITWLAALTFGLTQSGTHGWTAPQTLIPLAVAAAGLAAFLLFEARTAHPMLPLHLFTRPMFALSNVASFALGFGAYSVFILLSVYLQNIRGYSAASAGLRYLPLCGAIAVMSVCAGRLTARIGPAAAMAIGYVITGSGLLAILTFDSDTSYWIIALVFSALGTGMGLAIAPTTAAALGSVERQHSGIASGVVNSARQAGNTLGIAVLGSIITQVATGSLQQALTNDHGVTTSEAQQVAAQAVTNQGAASGQHVVRGSTLRTLHNAAFTDGMHIAVLVAAVLTFLAAALVLTARPHRRPAATAKPSAPRGG
ncbi:MFS transporter [Streptomyces sp. PU-14G]|uniref:MFS transporter n=1 Tax=Streptomyces sp. PU-14G TaxID=2800808 RepID=UPI0034DE3973